MRTPISRMSQAQDTQPSNFNLWPPTLLWLSQHFQHLAEELSWHAKCLTPLEPASNRESDITTYLHSSEERYESALADRRYHSRRLRYSSPTCNQRSGAQTPASAAGTPLGPDDTYFVTQTSLGTPFQVDSGRLAETKGTTQAIRSYAELMVSSHITVNNALLAILKNKVPVPPPTLLKAAYATMVSTFSMKPARRLTLITFGGRSITRGPTPLSMNMKLRMAQILI
jgi:hypothetical protein